MKTIGEVSEETLRIQAFLEKQERGAELSYLAIEGETGVRMDVRGKAKIRWAAKRVKIEYTCIRDVGIKIADAREVMPILSTRVQRIDSAVRKADKSHRNLQEQFFAELPEEEQKNILFLGAVFGAIRVASGQGKKLYGKRARIDGSTMTISIPKISY